MALADMDVNGFGSQPMPPRFRKARFNPPEASDYLSQIHGIQIARSTLDKKRCVGGGPSFERFGRAILYPRKALDIWALQQLSALHSSTADF